MEEDQINERFKEAQGRNGGGGGKEKLFLRTVTVSGAGVLRVPHNPIMCLIVYHDIDAVFWVKNTWIISTLFLTLITGLEIPLARNLL